MPRILVLDSIAQEGLDLLDAAPGIEYEVRTGLKGKDLHDALLEADGAICRSGVKITPESLEGNTRLRAIARAGVGTDNIDLTAATRLGIIVMNTPTGNTLSTAEHTVAMMLALSRNIAPAHQSLVEGRWDRKTYMGTQLAGKTLGVVGLGRIGQAVAARAKALEMRVLGVEPMLASERMAELGIEPFATVKEMLPHIDYLTVHTPLNEQTRDMISTDTLELLKPGVRLINCARGGIYNEAALVEGLKQGKIGGVALDVFAEEPCTDSPLFGMSGVVATPHLGASTEEAQTQVAVEAVNLVIDYLTTGGIRHSVNAIPLDPQKMAVLRPYLNVAYRLGLVHGQLLTAGQSPRACRLSFRGDVAQRETRILGAAFACGLLHKALDAQANIVNAEVLLRERGISLSEESSTGMGAFSSLIAAEVETQDETRQTAGTVFGQDMPRLVQFGTYRLEAFLDGTLLIFEHRDVPGIIGCVGTIFGKHGVNIAQMAVGRRRSDPGGDAVGVLNLDNQPSAEALEEVRQHPDISKVEVIQLPAAGDLPAWLA